MDAEKSIFQENIFCPHCLAEKRSKGKFAFLRRLIPGKKSPKGKSVLLELHSSSKINRIVWKCPCCKKIYLPLKETPVAELSFLSKNGLILNFPVDENHKLLEIQWG